MIQGAFGAELDPFCIIKIIVNLRGQGWEIMAIRLGVKLTVVGPVMVRVLGTI